MDKVQSKEFYVPKHEHLNPRPCPTPPVKRRIFEEIQKEMKRVGLNFGIKDSEGADTQYFLAVLSSCNPEHEFFSKDYVPVAQDSKYSHLRKQPKPVLDNANGFYNNLPIKQQKVKPAAGIPIAHPRVHVRMHGPEETASLRELRKKLAKMKIYMDRKQSELDAANAQQRLNGGAPI